MPALFLAYCAIDLEEDCTMEFVPFDLSQMTAAFPEEVTVNCGFTASCPEDESVTGTDQAES